MDTVETELAVSFEGDHIRIISNGEKNFEFASRLWTQAVEACKKNDCFTILGVANSSRPPDTFEGFDHAQLFRDLDIGRGYRIAWVEQNRDAFESIYFIETVLVNRGVNIRLFSDVSEAKDWLLNRT